MVVFTSQKLHGNSTEQIDLSSCIGGLIEELLLETRERLIQFLLFGTTETAHIHPSVNPAPYPSKTMSHIE